MKAHIMRKEPYINCDGILVGYVGTYKSLCGIKEPHSQVYGSIIPTCKRCIKIQKGKERA